MLGIIAMLSASVHAENEVFKTLEGTGYREQELQQSKGANFATEVADGVEYVSYAGGTHIFVKGQNLGEDAS